MNKLLFTFFILFTCINSAKSNSYFTDKNAYKHDNSSGCYINDVFFKVGTRIAMNKVELESYKEKTGYQASDGYAVMMQCIYTVDPEKMDHPAPKDRHYVWVAS